MLSHSTLVYVTILAFLIQIQIPGHETKDFSGPDLKGQKITRIKIPMQVRCGAKYSCGFGATCQNGICKCDINKTGEARLACVPLDSFSSKITGDPVVTAYDGSTAHVSFSCRTLFTEVKSLHYLGRAGGRCHTKLYTLLHREIDGYYLLAVDLELNVKDRTRSKVKAKVAYRIYGYEEDGEAAYKEQSHINHRLKSSNREKTRPLQYVKQMVRTSYSIVDNIVTMSVPACGITTHFRAHVKYSHQFPGLAVSISKKHKPKFPDSNFPLSGTPHAPGEYQFIKERHALHLTREQLTLYKSLRQDSMQDFGINGLSCTIANKMFNRLCPDDASKALAVSTCSGFYTNSTTLNCILSGEFGASSSSMFALCTQAMCLNHQSLCEDVKNEMSLVGCGLHKELDDLDCSGIAGALKKFRGMVFNVDNKQANGIYEQSMFGYE